MKNLDINSNCLANSNLFIRAQIEDVQLQPSRRVIEFTQPSTRTLSQTLLIGIKILTSLYTILFDVANEEMAIRVFAHHRYSHIYNRHYY